MIQRLLTAIVGIPIVLAVLWQGYWAFWILIGACSALALLEFYTLTQKMGFHPRPLLGSAMGLLLLTSMLLGEAALGGERSAFFTSSVFTGCILLAFTVEVIRADLAYALPGMAAMLLGIYLVPWTMGHLLLLRDLRPEGRELTLLLFLTIWLMDTAAYAIGLPFGRHRLAPRVSPMKSVEGAIASVLAATLFCAAASHWIPSLSWKQGALLGFLISLLGQFGDLAESLVKRSAGEKDSGSLFPGHGGMLDRVDSFLFAAPAFYYALRFMK